MGALMLCTRAEILCPIGLQDVEDYTAHLPATHKETATYSGYGPDIVPLHNCNRGPDFGDKVRPLHQTVNTRHAMLAESR